jgi:GTP cyclohydrolase II
LKELGPCPTVRINSACFTGDIFGDERCDCNEQFLNALDRVQEEGGLILYHFHHEGRGGGFTSKLRALDTMAKQGLSTFAAMRMHLQKNDLRQYGAALAILKDLNIRSVRLISNNPEKIAALVAGGIRVVECKGYVSGRPELKDYLLSKRHEQGHRI